MDTRYKPIADYGVVGDLNTVALIGMDGSVDFMCFPDFDSPTIFAALLDADRGGAFKVAPAKEVEVIKQLYLPDTNVLMTRFLSRDGVAELTDFMPVREASGRRHTLVRQLRVVRGEIPCRLRCEPRFDYARVEHDVRLVEGGARFIASDGQVLELSASVPLTIEGGAVVADFVLSGDEEVVFMLSEGADASPDCDDFEQMFTETVGFWRRWIAQCDYQGRWRELVHRSALVLKLLISRAHGSMVAAPTFSLPEEIGGVRNWDYRYTWIRDSSFVLYALIRLGFTEEATAFFAWLEERCFEVSEADNLQVMYRLDGGTELTEVELEHLEGYQGSRPVRIGNGAADQLQLDIYGELMDAVYLYDKHGEPLHHGLWRRLVRVVDWVCDNWRQPDEGIWEVRGGRREFLYSRLMCWVAIDRATRLIIKRSLPGPFERWRQERDAIYHDIHTHFWNEELGSFVQYKGSDVLDASCLVMPLVKFISPTDRRWLSTLRAIERELVWGELVFRYRLESGAEDGLSGGEGTFSMCTFWYIECLARTGDLTQARLHFEKALGYSNHLGLYAEELGPCGEHLGNFPQAFTHLALISAAFDLDRRLSSAGHPS